MKSPAGFRAKPLVVSLIVLVAVFSALYVWRIARVDSQGPYAGQPIPVTATKIVGRTVSNELQALGELQAVHEVLLSPDTAGRVTAIHFEAGQMVNQGALLLQLFDAPEQADLLAASARAEFAQLQLERARELVPVGAESQELLEQRQAEANQAMAGVRQLEARIIQKRIRAPFTGQLGIRRIDLGQYLNPGDVVATLTQLDSLYINFMLPQQALSELSVGALVQVAVDAAPDRLFTAKVSSIEPKVNSETRNILVQAELANQDHSLRPGMYASARLELPPELDAVVLPLTAIQTSAFGDTVVVVRDVNPDGVGEVETVPVTLGRRLGDDVLVEGGVNVGDVVVSAGQNRLPSGAQVKVSFGTPNTSSAAAQE
ncbi:efflux RND transporter periplasmic adaptor subunit [Zhongshania sp. BJYM1]|uniref:efflux RND transporter periplasmic adaptor subunit n=1 Tax=Zhongshania aquatica TaxID=2965069 RepID=UPI0022B3A611|nr:efflux RND transporter periplasmic adaptor subunit [Marortus sp. BJYM1]